jgi:hypothetical protein
MKALAVPKIFMDETSSRILLATLYRPRTALGICRATGLPVADVFSRLVALRRVGLIGVDCSKMDTDGKDVPVYHSQLHNVYFFITDDGRLRARFQLVACGQAELACDRESLL